MEKLSLLGPTKRKIGPLLLGQMRTATDIASILSIQVSAARKHLEALKRLEVVDVKYLKSGIGRPKKFYLLTENGRELFPRQYHTLLNKVISRMLEDKDTAYAESVMKGIATVLATKMSDGKEDPDSIKHLVNQLNDFGFESSLRQTKDSYEIISRNCPLYKTASAYQKLVCHGLHDEIIRSATGVQDVKLDKCMVLGDPVCVHNIPKVKVHP